jgi:hypothetical protein
MFALKNIRSYRVIKGLSNKEKTSIGLFYKEVGILLGGCLTGGAI